MTFSLLLISQAPTKDASTYIWRLHLRELVKNIPANRLMIETDAPYLIPRDLKLKTRRNEPKHLPHIAQVVAELRGVDLDEFIQTSVQTTKGFFF